MTLRTVALSLALAFSVVACDDGGTDDTDTGPDLTNGETLFTTNCAGCHGADGTGTESGPDFTDAISSSSDDDLKSLIQNGRESMPAFGSLTDGDIADILAYAKTL